MKSALPLIILLFVGASFGQQFKRGRVVTSRRSSRAIKPTSEVCATSQNLNQKYCNGADALGCDSTGFIQCRGIGKGITWDCGGDLPYCNEERPGEAECSTIRHTDCSSAESEEFECLEEGFFPDPFDCKKYYQCYDDGTGNLLSDELACDNYFVFDPSAPNNDYCRFTMNRYCVKIDCKGKVQNILMNYPFFPRQKGEIVATCRINKKPLVTHCRAGFQANLKSMPVQCKFFCNKPSKFQYVGDETKYYDCVFNGKTWEGKVKSCYRNYYFNAARKQCEYRPTQPTTSNTPTPKTVTTSIPSTTTSATTISTTTTIIPTTTTNIIPTTTTNIIPPTKTSDDTISTNEGDDTVTTTEGGDTTTTIEGGDTITTIEGSGNFISN